MRDDSENVTKEISKLSLQNKYAGYTIEPKFFSTIFHS